MLGFGPERPALEEKVSGPLVACHLPGHLEARLAEERAEEEGTS